MEKQVRVYGQQMVEERTQLILEKVEINKVLGYEKFDINTDLEKLSVLIGKYGIGDTKTHLDLISAMVQDLKESIKRHDRGVK